MIIALIVLALISVIISNWMAWLIVKKNSKIEELIGKLGELEESNRGQYGLLTQHEKDIIKLEDENKSYKKVLGNLQEEVDVLIDEKREVEGKIKEIFKEFLEEEYVMVFDELAYENIPWALEQIKEKMNEWLEKLRNQDDNITILKEFRDEIQKENDGLKAEIKGQGKEAESISRLESYDFSAVMTE